MEITGGKTKLGKIWITLFCAAIIRIAAAGDAAAAPYFSDNVESAAKWTAAAPWATITSASHSATHAWTDSPAGSYANNADISLTMTAALDLSAATGPQLVFWHKYQLETDYDFGYVEISADGGSTWSAAKLATYTGIAGWKREQINLTAFAGQANLKIRFRLVTDKTLPWDGWTIDDISIDEPPNSVATLDIVNPQATALDITWSASLDPAFASYRIYRSTSVGVSTNSTLVTTINAIGAGTLTYTDTNLAPNTTYYYKVYVFNSSDLAAGNKEASGKTAVAQFAYPYYDDLEGSVDGWMADPPWGRTSADKHSGTYAWTDSPDSSYAAGADTSLQFSIDLGTAIMPVLSFWQRYTLDINSDYAYVEMREVGTTAWKRIYFATGTLASWTEKKVDLSDYAGKKIDLRFRVVADTNGIQSDGWYIDDIRIGETQSPLLAYPFKDGMETGANWHSSSWAPVADFHSGSFAFTDSPAGDYGALVQSELIMANTIDLRGSLHPQLSFWHKYTTIDKANYGGGGGYYTTEYDYCHVYLSTNKGQAGTWTQLAAFKGNQSTWIRKQIDLSNWAGLPDVRIKFVMNDNNGSDGVTQKAGGWTLDDVVVEDVPLDVTLSMASSSMQSVALAWSANADADFDRYEIYRSSASGVTRSSALVGVVSSQNTTSFTDNVAIIQPGTYYYRVWVVDKDSNISLGSNEVTATYTVPVNTYPFSENGESGQAQWSWGTPWGLTDVEEYGGTYSWTDSPGANYPANADTSLTTFVNLTGATTPVLTFWHKYSLEEGKDFVYLETSADSGLTWTALRTFTGTETTWNYERVNLTFYAGNAKMGLRFRLVSNASNQQDGWYMDNLQIKEEAVRAAYPFTDGMENGPIPWFYDSRWEIVELPAGQSRSGTAPSRVWTDSPNSSYPAGSDSSLMLTIDLGAAAMPVLSFWHKYSYDTNSDFGYVEVREVGATAWKRLYFATGTMASWGEAKIDLSNYAGKQIDLRFRVTADSSTESDGWYIDDIRIGETQSALLAYPFKDGMETGSNWHSSSWALSADPQSGSFAFTDSPSGDYGDLVQSELIMASTLDMRGSFHPQLSFWHKYSTIDKANYGGGGGYYTTEYDYCRVYLSTNKGQAGTWTQLAAFKGNQSTWMRKQIDLSNWAGLPDVRIKFVMNDNNGSDGVTKQAGGWTLDEVAVEDAPRDSDLAITSSSLNAVSLAWTANAEADFDRYEIYRSSTPGVTRNDTLISTIMAKDTTSYTDAVALIQPGTYYYRIWVLDKDINISLGSNEVKATYTIPLNIYPFSENGESGQAQWSWGTPWGLTDVEKYGGTYSWTDSPGANYPADADTSLTTFINLTGTKTPVLSFWHKYSLEENKDFMQIEVSTNNGQTWNSLRTVTGTETTWNYERVNFTPYAGNAKLGLRFRLLSDAQNQQDGWYMDNLQIKEEPSQAAYPFMDGMEMGPIPWFYDSPWEIVELPAEQSRSGTAPSRVWTDSPNSSYRAGGDSSLMLTIDLGAARMPLLSFWHKYSFEANSDFGYVEVRETGGSSWKRLYFTTGTQASWVEKRVDLSEYAGKQIDLRFRVIADTNGIQSDGWYIDDVSIAETQHLPFTYPFMDDMENLDNWHGSSWAMVSDKYSGTYAVTDSAEGNYGALVSSELVLASTVDLRGSRHPQLSFWHKYTTISKSNYGGGGGYYTTEYDNGRVYLSTNKGQAGTWTQLAAFKGNQAAYKNETISLSNWAGLPDVRIKFVMDDSKGSDGVTQLANGWTLDQIRIGEDETIPSSIAAVSGDGQIGQTGKTLADALVVKVTDSDSKPRAGIQVDFTITGGAGSLSTTSGSTGAEGKISTLLTLDAVAGANVVMATITGTTQSVTFTATGYATGQALRVSKVSGDKQVGAVNTALPNPLVVKVTDILGAAVAGANVTFSRIAGNGSLAVTTAIATDTGGLAQNNFTLGTTTGVSTIAAAATGLLGSPVSFTANAVMTGGTLGDTDGDGMPDVWESLYGLNPLDSADALLDGDGDGLTNREEYIHGTNPTKTDTDNDGMPDKWEIQYGLDPRNPADASQDSNNNGISNLQEYLNSTIPTHQKHFLIAGVTTESMYVYGLASIDGIALQPGDEVAAICPNNVVCGQYTVDLPGQYGFMNVYRDDPATPAVEGALPGENLIFRIWDASEQVELDTVATVVTGTLPPAWTADGGSANINLNAAGKQIIPLRAGWNLISLSVKNCYYVGNAVPAEPMLTNIHFEKVNSLADALSSIDGLYEAVRGFDGTGAHTFDPLLPQYSDLTYLAAGYGYWIKMKVAGELVLSGLKALPTDSLELRTGWNLVGYWGNVIHYVGIQPTVVFPPDATIFTQINSMTENFNAIVGNYSVVRSFDAAGAHTFDPLLPDYFNSLQYMGPGYGMWIKMKSPDALSY